MDFDPLEYSMDCVGIFAGKPLGFFQRVCLNHDKTAGFIGERAGQDDSACLIERFHFGQVSRTVDFPFGFTVGTIESNDNEFHT
jgi:hypothetical protein